MDRRTFIGGIAGGLVIAPQAGHAQKPALPTILQVELQPRPGTSPVVRAPVAPLHTAALARMGHRDCDGQRN